MKDEKRLYIIGTVIYLAVVLAIYLLLAGVPGSVATPKPQLLVFGIRINLLGRACLSAFGPALLLGVLINKFAWRWTWFRFVAGIRIPCVQGRWEGYLLSAYTQHKRKHKIAVEFWQALQKIRVWYYDENAVTTSLIADYVLDLEGGPMRIFCIYLNHPIRTNQPTLQYHQGVMELYVSETSREIHGTYYNNPHQRATYGEMHLTFAGKKLRRSFKYTQPESIPGLWTRLFRKTK